MCLCGSSYSTIQMKSNDHFFFENLTKIQFSHLTICEYLVKLTSQLMLWEIRRLFHGLPDYIMKHNHGIHLDLQQCAEHMAQ